MGCFINKNMTYAFKVGKYRYSCLFFNHSHQTFATSWNNNIN